MDPPSPPLRARQVTHALSVANGSPTLKQCNKAPEMTLMKYRFRILNGLPSYDAEVHLKRCVVRDRSGCQRSFKILHKAESERLETSCI